MGREGWAASLGEEWIRVGVMFGMTAAMHDCEGCGTSMPLRT